MRRPRHIRGSRSETVGGGQDAPGREGVASTSVPPKPCKGIRVKGLLTKGRPGGQRGPISELYAKERGPGVRQEKPGMLDSEKNESG